MDKGINQITSTQQLKLQRGIAASGNTGTGFDSILQEQLSQNSKLHFSKHASMRVEQRGIEVSETVLQDLSQAVEKARTKGAKDMVVISDQGAFIVNVPNNVVVTTIDKNDLKENVFTNIDSAAII